jgi:hypothetical protein
VTTQCDCVRLRLSRQFNGIAPSAIIEREMEVVNLHMEIRKYKLINGKRGPYSQSGPVQ